MRCGGISWVHAGGRKSIYRLVYKLVNRSRAADYCGGTLVVCSGPGSGLFLWSGPAGGDQSKRITRTPPSSRRFSKLCHARCTGAAFLGRRRSRRLLELHCLLPLLHPELNFPMHAASVHRVPVPTQILLPCRFCTRMSLICPMNSSRSNQSSQRCPAIRTARWESGRDTELRGRRRLQFVIRPAQTDTADCSHQ